MNALIQTLVELQDTLRAIEEAQRRERDVPALVEALDRGLQEAARSLNAAREELSQAQKERRRLEMEASSIEALISRHQDQLMTVKTNDAYRALQHEIDQERVKVRGLEDRILDLMERADLLGKQIRTLEAEHGAERSRVEEEKRRVGEMGASASREILRLRDLRAGFEKRLPADLLDAFNRIARVRGGVAIVRAQSESCGGCNVRLRPQVFQELRRGETLISCDSCKRFLYWVEEPRPPENAAGGPLEQGHAPAGS